jgi:hypothetical protein
MPRPETLRRPNKLGPRLKPYASDGLPHYFPTHNLTAVLISLQNRMASA